MWQCLQECIDMSIDIAGPERISELNVKPLFHKGDTTDREALALSCHCASARSPRICSLPHNLHFSHPTQSMTRVIFWKCFCRSRFSSTALAPFHNRPSSKGMGQVFLSASLLTCNACHLVTGSCPHCAWERINGTHTIKPDKTSKTFISA